MKANKPILVTGSHRSGTTWMGRLIAESPSVMYFHEPFNVDAPPRPWSLGYNKWFKYISQESKGENQPEVAQLLKPRVSQLLEQIVLEAKSLRDVSRLLRDNARILKYQITGVRPLIKDPIALLSAEWLADLWDARVVVMVRHPAAFAGSLKVKGWTFPFEDLLDQPKAMERFFSPYKEEIRHFAETDQDVVDQAALLWKLLYSVVSGYDERHPDWVFLRHEDVARNPNLYVQDLYQDLSLKFTEEIRKKVNNQTDPSVIRNWTNRLNKEEISKVRDCVKPISSLFYSDDEWKL